jgi:hypothetical protein
VQHDFDQNRNSAACLLIQFVRKIEAIYGLDPIKIFDDFPGFVRLKVPDEMPCEGQIAKRLTLWKAFLQSVLADVSDPERGYCSNPFRTYRLRYGDKTNRLSTPAASCRPSVNSFDDTAAIR